MKKIAEIEKAAKNEMLEELNIIGNSSSGLQGTLAAFCEKGCKIAGMVKVNGIKSWRAEGFKLENAIKMQMPR